MLTLLISRFKARFTADLKQIDWSRTALLIGLILATASALWQFAMPTVRTITVNQFHPVPVIHETIKIKRVLMQCPESGIVVLDKAEVAKKLKLDFLPGGNLAAAKNVDKLQLTPGGDSPSPEGTQPANLQVTGTAELPESDDGVDVVSLMNMETGETTLVAKERPSPWFQFRNDAALGIKYGFNQHLIYTGTAYGRWDFLRIKDVYLSTNADLSTDGSARLQLGMEYRW